MVNPRVLAAPLAPHRHPSDDTDARHGSFGQPVLAYRRFSVLIRAKPRFEAGCLDWIVFAKSTTG